MSEQLPESDSTRVWLVEDNASYRKTIARVIDRIQGMSCPQNFASCEKALSALDHEPAPDVILIDIGLPGMDGIEGVRRFKAILPNVHLIILTVFGDQEKVFNAICAGASGYLLKTSPAQEITEGIREVMNGGAPMNSRIARMVLKMFSGMMPHQKQDYGLTDREREILNLMVEGFIKKEIADRLDISFHTVDSHLRNIYTKLQVNTQTGAVAKALRERLI